MTRIVDTRTLRELMRRAQKFGFDKQLSSDLPLERGGIHVLTEVDRYATRLSEVVRCRGLIKLGRNEPPALVEFDIREADFDRLLDADSLASG